MLILLVPLLARLPKSSSQNCGTAGGRGSRRWVPGEEKKAYLSALLRGSKNWALLGWLWSVKSVTNEESGSSQLSVRPPHLLTCRGSKIEHLPLHLPSYVDNQCGSDIERVSEPTEPVWSSNSSYPWINGCCCCRWGRGHCICSILSSAAKFWKLQRWPIAPHYESRTESPQESSFWRKRPLSAIGQFRT